MRILIILLLGILVGSTHKMEAQDLGMLSNDSLKNIYSQYEAYTPTAAELKDYHSIKYQLSWMMGDFKKVQQNLGQLKNHFSGEELSNKVAINFEFFNKERALKAIDIFPNLISEYNQDNIVKSPLLFTYLMLLNQVEKDDKLAAELPNAREYFAKQGQIVDMMDLIEMELWIRQGNLKNANETAEKLYIKNPNQVEVIKTIVKSLYSNQKYNDVLNWEDRISKGKIIALFPQIAFSYLAISNPTKAKFYLDEIYKNLKYPMEQEIDFAINQLDTSIVIRPEAILQYTDVNAQFNFEKLDGADLEKMGDFYVSTKEEVKACDFYQYAILNINSYLVSDADLLYEDASQKMKMDFKEFEKISKKKKEAYQVAKEKIINKTNLLKKCDLRIQ